MTTAHIDADVQRRLYDLQQARAAYEVALTEQWRVHGEAWLTACRAEFPTSEGWVEYLDHQTLGDNVRNSVVCRRTVERIVSWDGEPWASKARRETRKWWARGNNFNSPASFYGYIERTHETWDTISPQAGREWGEFVKRHRG